MDEPNARAMSVFEIVRAIVGCVLLAILLSASFVPWEQAYAQAPNSNGVGGNGQGNAGNGQGNGGGGNNNGNGVAGNGNGNAGNGQGNGGRGTTDGNETQTEAEGGTIVVGNVLREYATLSYLGFAGDTAEIEIGGACGLSETICMTGDTIIEFLLSGNARVRLRVQPDQRVRVDQRRFGVFTYDRGPAIDPPPVYYDVGLEVVELAGSFVTPDPISPDQISIEDLSGTRQSWAANANLRRDNFKGRITIQPLFVPTETDIFAAVGEYSASLRLSIQTR